MKRDSSDFNLPPELLKGCEFHDNISQVYIRTTEDKLLNILRDFKEAYSTKYSWTTPLGLFVSFLATLLTATFIDKFGLEKGFWQASFAIMCILSFLWLCSSVYIAITRKKETNLQYIIDRIKDSVQQ
jgi:hypothetical protein